MPITFSHPAAVVPLLGVGLVPSALVIGSITPDLPYYLPGPLTSARTHAVSGIVTFDLALGLLAFLVWHVLLAPTAVALAPAALRERLAPGLPVPVREHLARWWVVLVSLVIGAATHVVWDSFSHPGRWGTNRIAWLREEHGPVMGYTWVQYGSGALGFVVLALVVGHWWLRTPRTAGRQRVPAFDRRVVLICVVVVLVSGVIGAVAGLATADENLFAVLFRMLTWGCGAAGAGWLAFAVVARSKLTGS
ncbi:DUF4184 family protein [Solirubrobacter taibaiensis]|nr:DUF4184 family protein [Solirubrobacter taibaiensis]